MLPRKLRKQLKQFDIAGHSECCHNWIHNAGKQCEWDKSSINPQYKADSIHIAYMYICTMCGGEFWSSDKCLNIPHYRVKEATKWRKKM